MTPQTYPDEQATQFMKQLSQALYERSSEFKKNPQDVATLQAQANVIILELQAGFSKTQ